MNTKKMFLCICITALAFVSYAQLGFRRADSVKVFENNAQLKLPWAGAHNFVQTSVIDLDFDGIKDLVVFDRTSNSLRDKITTYINNGTANTVDYVHAPQYEKKFPAGLHDWLLLKDYNGDGKEDIFTYENGAIRIYKNTSTSGNLQFSMVVSQLKSSYIPHTVATYIILYSNPIDIPGIEDVDHDGDIDIVAFNFNGITLDYHKNLSMETYGNADSLNFWQDKNCWGNFEENASNNTITLNACSGLIKYDPITIQHAGSSVLLIDMDADRDYDCVLGDVSYCSMNMLTNGNDSSLAIMAAEQTFFPNNTFSTDLNLYPLPFYLDVNNDNKRDLIVGNGAANVSDNQKSIWYYQNTGTDAAPVFNFVKKDMLQDEMIEIGEGSYPVFFDFDADGLKDLLIGNHRKIETSGCTNSNSFTSVHAYKNTGTATSPQFTFVTNDYAGLSSVLAGELSFIITFGDIDNDGDDDMIIGNESGELHRFNNTAGAGNPAVFVQLMPYSMVDNTNTIIDAGTTAAPQLFDVDRDGILDLLIGERSGRIRYYKNTGSLTTPVFTLTSNNIGNVDVLLPCCGGYAVPFMFNDSGTYEMFVGSEQGYVFHYTNIDNNLTGSFTKVDSLLSQPTEVWEGQRVAANFADITNDGLMDMIVGNYRGGAALYLGDLSMGIKNEIAIEQDIAVFPNPSTGNITIRFKNAHNNNVLMHVYNTMGQMVYQTNFDNSQNRDVNLTALGKGVYVCKFLVDGKQFVKRIVIQ
jgi:hypothetical protein